jgi:hypothetical protein
LSFIFILIAPVSHPRKEKVANVLFASGAILVSWVRSLNT